MVDYLKNPEVRRVGMLTGLPEEAAPPKYDKNISGTKTTWWHKMRPSPKFKRGEYLRWLRKQLKMARKGKKWTAEDEAKS